MTEETKSARGALAETVSPRGHVRRLDLDKGSSMDQPNRGAVLLPLTRMLVVVLALVALVLIPFVMWGKQMDVSVPKLVEDQPTQWAIALIGFALLVLDVLLPVPSSIVSISVCLLLGPAWGAPVVFVGMVGAFVVGYVAGQMLPTSRLRAWVGPRAWDSVATHRQTAGMLWIAASRPIPVLAEVTSLLAGSLRLPFGPSLAAAAGSSLLVAAAYGTAAWMGFDQTGSSTALLVFFVTWLPAVSWASHRWMAMVLARAKRDCA